MFVAIFLSISIEFSIIELTLTEFSIRIDCFTNLLPTFMISGH